MMKMRLMTTKTKMRHCGAKSPLLGSGGDSASCQMWSHGQEFVRKVREGLGKGKWVGGGEKEVCV